MTKLIFGLFFLTYITMVGCDQTEKKQPQEQDSKTKTEKSFQEEIQEYKKTIPATNRNPENDEWRNNVYRNKFYKFRIEFPKGWEYDAGTTKTTLARAINREHGAAFSVTITHLPDEPPYPNDIIKSSPPDEYGKDFNKILALQNTKAENLKIEKGFLNNFPAYLIEFTQVVSSGSRTFTYLGKQIQCYYDSKIYQINLNLPVDAYDNEMNKFYHRVVESFNFEIAY